MASTAPFASFPDRWEDLLKLNQALGIDLFLQSDLFNARRNLYMSKSILTMVSGSIYFLSSMMLVFHILRSNEDFTLIYNRLAFGLSMSDMLSSCKYSPPLR
jgi:hypothetical protein